MNAATARQLIKKQVRVLAEYSGRAKRDCYGTLIAVKGEFAEVEVAGQVIKMPVSTIKNSVQHNGHIPDLADEPREPPKPAAVPSRTVAVPPAPSPPPPPRDPLEKADLATLLAEAQSCVDEIKAARALMEDAAARRKRIVELIRKRRDELDALTATLEAAT